ncbi:MAG TPA: DUF4173 domain-containing protein [Candidatus Saccharimonadales bacterium]|nr:DUF4173 domain-containing protein [Candidatus Saccharimonadales bacterium]
MNIVPRTMIAAGASLGLGLLFDYLFYNKLPGISFPLYVALVVAGVLATIHFYKIGLSSQAKLLFVPLAFFSVMVFVRADGFVTFLNIIASLYLGGLLLYAVFAPKLRMYTSSQYATPINELPGALREGFKRAAADATGTMSVAKRHPALPQVIRGIAITLPVLALFAILLSSADLVFRKYVTDVFSFSINGDLMVRLFLVAVITSICFGIFGYLAYGRKQARQDDPQKRAGILKKLFGERGNVEVAILLVSVGLLFLGFILIQLTYLFGGMQNITDQGFTYAYYARKGFFELIFVAAVTYLLVVAGERVMLHGREKHSTLFKVLSSVLIFEVLIMMASAFKRLALYESAYGFTTLRVLSHVFTIWLVLVFAVLLYKILRNHKESTFAFLNFTCVMLLLVFINVYNVDAFVARKNIARYHATGKLDIGYLGNLSDDAVPEIAKLLDKPGNYRQDLERMLTTKRDELKEKDEWQSANISRGVALRVIDNKLE